MHKKSLVALCTVAGILAPIGASVALPASVYASQAMLKYGDKGTAVVTLQNDLNTKGYACGKADGAFGSATLSAVKAFQKAHGLTVDGVVGPSTWSALTGSSSSSGGPGTPPTGQRTLKQKAIYFNGKLVSSPMAFDDQGTDYMPIYYVQQMLKSIGIQYQWDGVHWNLIVPSTIKVDMTNVQIGTGKLQIEINGTLVKRVDGIANPDPASNEMTTYMPIFYMQGVLERLGIHKTWDGTNWKMDNTQSYVALHKDGSQIGQYQTQADAQSAVGTVPGGIVKDNLGNVVFTEPDFATYISPTTTPQEFVTQTAATAAIIGNANGYIVDMASNRVVQFPSSYYFVGSDGAWHSSLYGVVSASAPGFAQVGSKYFAVNVNNGHEYYLLAKSDGKYSGAEVGTDQNPYKTVDLRFPSPATETAAQIDSWFASKSSSLSGLGSSFIRAQNTYGVNATYLLSHAIWESGWGSSSISKAKNNLFGYGAYDADPANAAGNFPSEDYAIQYEGWVVRQNYLEPTGVYYYQSSTLNGENHYYATDPNWANGLATMMSQYVSETGGSASDYKQSVPGQSGPIPAVAQEPVFLMNGAQATAMANPYGSLPVFSDSGTGAMQMFPGTMKNGSSGLAVKTLQRAVGVTADGSFGPMTAAALQSYQQSHGLPVTGVCDLTTWQTMVSTPTLSIPMGTQVAVDSMVQGIVGGNVTEWYHVSAGGVSGWVDSQYVAFTNVYRIQPVSGSSATMYSATSRTAPGVVTMHAGDYVVSSKPSADGSGFIQIQVVNTAGQATIGYLDGSAAQLTQVPSPTPYSGT